MCEDGVSILPLWWCFTSPKTSQLQDSEISKISCVSSTWSWSWGVSTTALRLPLKHVNCEERSPSTDMNTGSRRSGVDFLQRADQYGTENMWTEMGSGVQEQTGISGGLGDVRFMQCVLWKILLFNVEKKWLRRVGFCVYWPVTLQSALNVLSD